MDFDRDPGPDFVEEVDDLTRSLDVDRAFVEGGDALTRSLDSDRTRVSSGGT